MTLAILSDIHGNHLAFQAVLEALPPVDQVLFLGDLCGYYPFVEECLALWDDDRMTGVRGNHDDVMLTCVRERKAPSPEYEASYGTALTRSLRALSPRSVALLQSWPVSRTITAGGATIALCHGAPWNSLEGRVYPDFTEWERFEHVPADIVLLGHTHYPMTKRHGGKLIINPGSVGQARDRGGEACYALLDLERGAVEHHRVGFSTERLIDDARRYDRELPYLVEIFRR